MIAKDTEHDVVLGPAPHWSMLLKPKLDALLSKKINNGKRIRPDDSNVLVSVNERSERDLIRRFDEVQVDWSVVEKRLLSWGELLHAGKRLRVDISFNYVEIQAALPTRGSTTQRMLAERAAQLDAEEASGTPSTWRDFYALMRCPGAPCDLRPHCWRDPHGKQHYPLKAHHMRSLIKHVDEGNPLECQADVPQMVRQQLYAEHQERSQTQHKTSVTAGGPPSITINNVLPSSVVRSDAIRDSQEPRHPLASAAAILKPMGLRYVRTV